MSEGVAILLWMDCVKMSRLEKLRHGATKRAPGIPRATGERLIDRLEDLLGVGQELITETWFGQSWKSRYSQKKYRTTRVNNKNMNKTNEIRPKNNFVVKKGRNLVQ